MEIRKAKSGELDEIMALVISTFAEQEIPAEILCFSPGQNPRWWVAAEDGRIIGTIAAFEEDGSTHLGRFAIDKGMRGRHIGTELILQSIEDLFADGVEAIYGYARDTSIHILLKHGGTTIGEPEPFYIGNATHCELRRENYHR